MLHYLIHSYCVVGTPNSEFGNPFAFRDFSWDVQVGTLSCCKPSDGISENTVARPVEQSYIVRLLQYSTRTLRCDQIAKCLNSTPWILVPI